MSAQVLQPSPPRDDVVEAVGGTSCSPTAGALLLGYSLDLLSQMTTNMMSIISGFGTKLADLKAAIAQASQTAQDNWAHNGDVNDNSRGDPKPNTIDWFVKNGDSGDGEANEFSIAQEELNTIATKFQVPLNRLDPLLTAYQNMIQALPGQIAALINAMAPPFTTAVELIANLLTKGI